MKRMRKRLLSLLLCICMVAGLLPVTAGAADAPAIITETLAEAMLGEAYTAQLTATASDQNGTLTWEATGLPNGLTLTGNEETAVLIGTPTEAGDFSVTVTVTETIPAAQPETPGEGTEPAEPTVLTTSRKYTLTVAEAVTANEPGTKPEAEPGAALLTEPEAENGAGSTRGGSNNINMTVTRDGVAVTEFANTDTIVITATLPTAPTSVTSVFFNDPAGEASGENWLYLDDGIGSVSFSGNVVTITLNSLYKAEVNQVDGEWVESKGDLLPPGNYNISFWDDATGGSTQYISNATYTVTPGGVEPGGEQGIYGADAFFTTQKENNAERILSGQPYAFYLYTEQPLTESETTPSPTSMSVITTTTRCCGRSKMA